jgi:ABC-type transport system substrate-binding protein
MTVKAVVFAAIWLLLAAIPSAPHAAVDMAGVDRLAQPRLDEIYMKVISDPDAATNAFLAGDVDFYSDIYRSSNIYELQAAGHTITNASSSHLCYLGINTRDYVPSDAGQPDAGRALAPLNWTSFRQALLWASPSGGEKAELISTVYGGPVIIPMGTVVPPALGIWHDPTVPQPGDNFTRAWELMEARGFAVVNSTMLQPNGIPVRDEIEVLSPAEATGVLNPLMQLTVEKWNAFADSLGVTNCNFIHDPIPFGVLVDRAFRLRNFDVYFLCWGLTQFPDFLHDFFHSSQEGFDLNNAVGVRDAELDALLNTLKFGLDHAAQVAAAHEVQRILMTELCPYVPLYSRIHWTAAANRSATHYLTGTVNQRGFGADNRWTWHLLHWSDQPTGGSVRYVLKHTPTSLHPGWTPLWPMAYDPTPVEADVLNRVFSPLIAASPTLAPLPWMAGNWTVEPFTWAPLGIASGTKITFQLRSGVTWHDGAPVTSADVQFAWTFAQHFPRFEDTLRHLVWAETPDPCTVVAYLNVTSRWVLYGLAELALQFPEHIYGHPCVQGPYAGASPIDAPVWNISYADWQGVPGPAYPFMVEELKALIGCGPYVFDYWNTTAEIIHLVRNPAYWVDGSLQQHCWVASQRVAPHAEAAFHVQLVNTGSTAADAFVPLVVDAVNITVDGIPVASLPGPINLSPFEESPVYGPFTHVFHAKGVHYVSLQAYENDTLLDHYDFAIYVTIQEDVNLDFVVDIFDVVVISRAFGHAPGAAGWDVRADLTGDCTVDIFDVVKTVISFGWA